MALEPLAVLVVDDDFRIAQLHARYVEQQEGYRLVGVAHDCAEALAKARELRPDLVILDVYLPDRSGIEVVRGIRDAQLRCDVILITAAKELEIMDEAFRLGIFDYLLKPFGPDILKDALAKFRQYRAQLDSSSEPDQGFVEGLKRLRAARAPAALQPQKGIDARTLERIAGILRSAEAPSTAEQIGRLAGVSRSTARVYLNHLVERGDADQVLQYGTVGRPQVLFRRKP